MKEGINDSKIGVARPIDKHIANLLLQTRVGERVPPLRKIAEQLNVSLGAVSQSFSRIEQSKSVQLESQGRLGMFVRSKNLAQLWSMSIGEPLVVSFPLPSTSRIEGLATAVKTLCSNSGVEVFFIFIRGARRRLQALRQGKCHIAVVSSFSANCLCSDAEIYTVLPAGTFTSEHRVFFRDATIFQLCSPIKVAVDKDSFDQQTLSEMEFRDYPVEWVPATYPQLSKILSSGNADAIVWTEEEMRNRHMSDVLDRPLSDSVTKSVSRAHTSAVFTCSRDFIWAETLFNEVLCVGSLVHIQSDVIAGRKVPEY